MDDTNNSDNGSANLQENFSAYLNNNRLSLNLNTQWERYAESYTPPGLSPAIIGSNVPYNLRLEGQPLRTYSPLTPPMHSPSFVPLQQDNFIYNYNAHYQIQQQQQQQQQQKRHQEQQQILAHHKYLQAIAQQQVVTSNQHKQDEIAKSLQSFANCAVNNDVPPIPVEEVMQEFACNGYACDWVNQNNNYSINGINSNFENTSQLYGTTYMTHFNASWNMMPSQMQQNFNIGESRTTTILSETTAAMANMSNIRHQKKPHKRQKLEKYTPKHCVFCENNNEPEAVIRSHTVRDNLGRVLCPKLRIYICPICRASGDKAHTLKYCPQKPIITMEDVLNAEMSGQKLFI